MIFKDKVLDKDIVIEIINSNRELSEKKNKYIYDTYKNKDLQKVLRDIDANRINSYIGVKLIKKGKIVGKVEKILYKKTKLELVETLLELAQEREMYEACSSILKIKELNKIKS